MKKKQKFYYEVVYEALKEEILENKHRYNDLLPSEREIGEHFNVDRTTVRKALSMLVEDDLVEKKAGVGTKVIYSAADEDGYNSTQQNQGSNVIGFFMAKTNNTEDRITQPFYSELFFYIENFLKAQNYNVIYTTLKDEHELADFISSQSIKGAIFLTAVEPHLLNYAKHLNMPAILVNRLVSDFTCVLGNNIEGGYAAIKHLLDNNHRKIAIISGPPSGYITAQERMIGCRNAFDEFGISFDDVVVKSGNWEYDSGFDAANEIFSVAKEDRPTALFAFNDGMALGAISAIRELGLRVPEDVSIVGFDNLDYLKFTEPNLTTIDTQVKLMAQAVTYNLLGLIDGYVPRGMRVDVPTKLIEGSTVTPLE